MRIERKRISESFYLGFEPVLSTPEWIWMFGHDINKPSQEVLKISGKWVFHRKPKDLEEIAWETFLPFVRDGKIKMLKYKTTRNDPNGPYRLLDPPICVYSSPYDKENIKKLILTQGVNDFYWQSDEKTREMEEETRKGAIVTLNKDGGIEYIYPNFLRRAGDFLKRNL